MIAMALNRQAVLLGLSSRALGARCLSTQVDGMLDVVIVGGGMVGAALAALLGSNPLTSSLRVVLLDQKAQSSKYTPSEFPELRVSTITPASICCLRKAGAWDDIAQHSAFFSHMQVWDYDSAGCIRWAAKDVAMKHMGCVAENSLLQASLLAAALRNQAPVETLWPVSVQGLRLPSPADATTSHGSPLGSSNPRTSDGQHAPSSSAAASTSNGTSTSTSASSQITNNGDLSPLKCAAGGRLEFGLASDSHRQTSAGGTTISTSNTTASALPVSPSARATASGASTEHTSTAGLAGGSPQHAADDNLAHLVLADGTVLRSRLVVAADGAGSRIRQLAGLRTFGWDYSQRGLVATVRMSVPNDTAWQRFLPTGPLGLLPVRDGYSNIVWSTSPDEARRLETLAPAAFAAAVNQALHEGSQPGKSALGMLTDSSHRYQAPPTVEAWVGAAPKSFPLQLKHAGRYVAPRLALVGDAAHAVHPLAGQGVNLGLADAEALAAAIAAARECGADIGDQAFLQEHYERPRQASNMAMAGALDAIKLAFAVQAGPLSGLRSLGLDLLNLSGPVKNQIMKYAMGMPLVS